MSEENDFEEMEGTPKDGGMRDLDFVPTVRKKLPERSGSA